MPDYLVTGQRGSGKGIVMATRMVKAFERGCVVATNMDIDLAKLFPPDYKDNRVERWSIDGHLISPVIYRLPDFPSGFDIQQLGVVSPSLDESTFGELILDELQVWLNARGWNDPRRVEFVEWLPQSRKSGWNTYFTSQTLNALDKQVRDLLEHRVHVVRTDRMGLPIPFLGWLITHIAGRLNKKVTLPRYHMGTVMYGNEHPPMIVDRWNYQGTDNVRNAYNTRQKYSAAYSQGIYGIGTYQYLPQSRWIDHTGHWAIVNTLTLDRRWVSGIVYADWHYPGRPAGWSMDLPYLVPPPLTFKDHLYKAGVIFTAIIMFLMFIGLIVFVISLWWQDHKLKTKPIVLPIVSTMPLKSSGRGVEPPKKSRSMQRQGTGYLISSNGDMHKF